MTAIPKSLEIAFDVGHSSIGWAVISVSSGVAFPQIVGCGTVLFPKNDCLASERRAFRRMRRHVRSTRFRIERIKRLLDHIGVLSSEALNNVDSSSPWQTAAYVLSGGGWLTWPQLWDVLRWYAHNRGYDGNRRWSRESEEDKEDTEKVTNARGLYEKHGTKTMAETLCKHMGIDPRSQASASHVRFKDLNAAFPREDVEAEVRLILTAHLGRLPGVTPELIRALIGHDRDDESAWSAIDCPALKMRLNYFGSLLFGQLIPRFENRIIATCPISFERRYQAVLAETGDPSKANHEAERDAKVPSKECVEFYRYRWAMQVANIRISTGNGQSRPLTAEERKALNASIEERGFFTAGELKSAVQKVTGAVASNLTQMLLHPDAADALILDPVRKLVNTKLENIWPTLTPQAQKRAIGKWRRGLSLKLGTLGNWCGAERGAFDAATKRRLDGEGTRRTKKQQPLSLADLLNESFSADLISGRAPFHRFILREVVEFVFSSDKHPAEEGGPLYRSESLRQTQLQRAIEDQTNNHLIRNRLTLLDRLHRDVLNAYAGGDPARVSRVTIEVNRDIREFSGKTAKEIATDLGAKLSNFKGVVKKLEKDFEGQNIRVSPGLIRKARIAEDLGWRCPYTGRDYDSFALAYTRVDKDHIIPRSLKPSDGLDALVVTFPEVNKLKGNRTALRFVEEFQGQPVPGRPDLTVVTLKQYHAFVDKLDTSKGHDDDKKRKKRRKDALQIKEYIDKEFTPRDLTQTSHLVRLGAQLLETVYISQKQKPVITSIPGSVTGAVRKSWRLAGCLAGINQSLPADSADISKGDLRECTHMHHALDACVQALASRLLPRDGGIWEILLKRRLNAQEQNIAKTRLNGIAEIDSEGRLRLADLPVPLKSQIRERLFEKRVVQHIPADQGGMACAQTVWRVFDPLDEHPSSKRIGKWFKSLKIEIPAPEAETVLIVSRKRKEGLGGEGGKLLHAGKTWRWVYDLKAKSALIGLLPRDPEKAKLKRIKAVKVLGDNFGLALDPEPTILRPIKVWEQLAELRSKNGGKRPRTLRRGSLISIPNKTGRADYRGIWVIRSVKLNQNHNGTFGLFLDISTPDRVDCIGTGQRDVYINVSLATLIKDGLRAFERPPLTGIAEI
jgi:hypothetical protein